MLYNDRAAFILQQLQLKSTVKVTEIAKSLNVSVDTVRRDLKALEEQGQLKCVHGGASLPDYMLAFSNFSGREIIHIEEKRRAALKALEYLRPGSVIALNSGTTNVILAQELIKRFSDLTIVTNNVSAAMVLMQNQSLRTIVLGGDLDSLEHSTYGSICERELGRYYPDICFLSINSVDAEAGFTDFRFAEIGVMQLMARNSSKVIAVMDSSKLGRRSKKAIMDNSMIDLLVMDSVEPDVRELYRHAGICIE